jgi:hypothetical protein
LFGTTPSSGNRKTFGFRGRNTESTSCRVGRRRHVHVIGPDFQAKVRIVDSEVFAGAIPPRHRREALSWISANAERLQEVDGEVE